MSLIKLSDVGKIYNSDGLLSIGIRNIDLELDLNEFVIITGESGSGKSTLLNIIGANDTYEEGEMFFNGLPTSHYDNDDWSNYRNQNIATIFQDFKILDNLTVLENVSLALFYENDKKIRKEKAIEIIKKVGLEKNMNQKASKLSGGEKQRCVIARGLAKNSPILLADEPTGNLDVKNSEEIASLLKNVSKDKLVIIVTHNPEFFIEYATRKIVLFDGKIQEDILINHKIKNNNDFIDSLNENDDKEHLRLSSSDKNNSGKRFNLHNAFALSFMNYKSRPRFSFMLTMALTICALTLFCCYTVFSNFLITNVKKNIVNINDPNRVVLSSIDHKTISKEKFKTIFKETDAKHAIYKNSIIGERILLPISNDGFKILIDYNPNKNNSEDETLIVLSRSNLKQKDIVLSMLKNANIGINRIKVELSPNIKDDAVIYLSNNNIKNDAAFIKYSFNKIRINETVNVSTRIHSSDTLKRGEINLINCNLWNSKNQNALIENVKNKKFLIISDDKKDPNYNNLVIEMNKDDYSEMFSINLVDKSSVVLYYKNPKQAKNAIKKINKDKFLALSYDTKIYNTNSIQSIKDNLASIGGLILICILFTILISTIFSKSIEQYASDFNIYKTLGIPNKVASSALHIQMSIIFSPSLIIVPLIAIVVTFVQGIKIKMMSFFDYLFIEVLTFAMIQYISYIFNKKIKKQVLHANTIKRQK